MMSAFPPPPDAQVTLANWRQAPFNRWAFSHVREILPTADIAADPDDLWRLPPQTSDLDRISFDDGTGRKIGLSTFLDDTQSDAFYVVHRGRTLLAHYAGRTTASSPHILMSVSKSMLGLLAGILVGQGRLDIDAPASSYVPELAGSAFVGASVRHLLDMRSGLDFDEDYLATSGDIIEYRKSTGWNPLADGEKPSDLRSFLPTLKKTFGPHGGKFNYVSPCTDLLGWIIERATGRRYADLMSELLWKPMGAAHSAYITVDRFGAPRCAGGMCVTAMDLARVGELLVRDGRRAGRQIIPLEWIDDIERNGDADAWDAGSFVDYYPGRKMHYRAKWYVEHGPAPMLFGLGIHGQNLFVDRKNELVVVKLSSQVLPIDPALIALTTRAVDAIRHHLA